MLITILAIVPLKGGGVIKADVVNNIVHNWGSRTIRMDGWAYELNHFENYYQAGGDTTNTLKWCSYLSGSGDPQIFTENNFLEDDPRGSYSVPAGYDTDESVAWTEFQNNFVPLPASYFTNTQHAIKGQPYTIYSNSQLKDNILPNIGASKYLNDNGDVVNQRDIYDQEAVDGINNNSSSTRDTDTTFPLSVASNTRPVSFYGTNQHIPSAWLIANGYSDTLTVHTDVQPSGYTLLEEYINQVDSVGQLAFPTAVGAGAYATGGRGGKVCHVDTLNWDTAVVYDAATDSYSGGFYNMFYELDIPAKEIVFNISGTIDVPAYTVLDFSTKTNKGNITVSGQTSNIVFSTDYFQIENISNLIWRYTSFYNIGTVAPGADVLWISSSTGNISENIIFDHCSFFYGGDECFSIASSSGQGEMNNVTVQWCLMAASSKGSIIGAYTGQSNATTAYCSYQDISYRFPNMLGYGSNSQQDVYNIFVGNYTSRLNVVIGDGNFNVQNMYVQANRANYGRHRMQYQSTAPCQLYAGGTIITGVQDTPAYPEFDDVWNAFASSSIPEYDPIPNDARASSAFPLIGKAGTIYDTADIKTEVLPYTGNTKRLANDGSVIEDEYALDTFYRDLGINKVSTADQTRFPATQYPEPNSATALTSTLKDGIPDIWRAANMNGESHDDIVSETGYTWLETFHNQVDSSDTPTPPDPPTSVVSGSTRSLILKGII